MGVVTTSSTDAGGDTPPGQANLPSRQDHPAPTNEPAKPPSNRFQILALDGGGAKALFTAHVLARLERDLGVSIKDSFDLIAGTSAGGIVVLGLGGGLTPGARQSRVLGP